MARSKRKPKPNSTPESAAASVGFSELSLSPEMLAALEEARYTAPTPVQAGVIPIALTGRDVMGQARTGTGKTAAFVIPILERLQPPEKPRLPQALILVPTRELAVQVRDELEKLGKTRRRIRSVALYGGKPLRGQIEKLKAGADIIVGTPGRVLDHLGRGTLVLTNLATVVLDEADRMLDIGFRPDIEKILRRCPRERQTLLLSATVPPAVQRLAQRYMRDAETLDLSPTDITVDTIDQFYFTVDDDLKFQLLLKLLEQEQPQQAIVFCRTKRATDKLHQMLGKRKLEVDAIHGDLRQSARDRVMQRFREGKSKLLVATDVVGRGIDVSGISHIINFDIPQFSDDYVHRVGRTGRMGRQGVAYTFVSPEEGGELTRIEMRINRLLKRAEIPGLITVKQLKKAPQAAPGTAPSDGQTGPPAPAGPPPQTRPKRYRRAL